MPGSYRELECPICRSRMAAPAPGARGVRTCRNGHSFAWEGLPRRPFRWPAPSPLLALVISVLLIVLFVAARRWPACIPFLHAG